jgi:hypothetical protein
MHSEGKVKKAYHSIWWLNILEHRLVILRLDLYPFISAVHDEDTVTRTF